MTLGLDVHMVSHVLLADGWHTVQGDTFMLDAYEYFDEKHAVLKGGSVQGVSSTGAIWTESNGARVACPVTAILAVRVQEHRDV